MRDPKRIDEVLGLLREYWTKKPDLRLCQIIGNSFIYLESVASGEPPDHDMSSRGYCMEDDLIIAYLRDKIDSDSQPKE